MKASFTLAAALVGALALPALANGPAYAGTGPNQLHSSASLLTLVAEGGGGSSSGGGNGPAAGGGPTGGHTSGGGPSGHVATGHDNRDNGHREYRHGHFVNGVWVWYGAPYASNDCSWLRHRAIATGSPYWWSRYHDCAY